MFTAGWIAGVAGWLVAGAEDGACACIAAFAAGNRLPSGLSTNFEAASTTRAGGSREIRSFFGAYEGSTNTKSVAAVFLASESCAVGAANVAVVTAAFGSAVAVWVAIEPAQSFSVSFSPGPGTSSYLQGRSRSTTTRVVAVASV